MKAYFYVFVSVSIVLFLTVMQQIRLAVAETNQEADYWVHFEIPSKHQ